MIKPTIHLNGSSPEHLAASYMVAYYAVRDAIKALDDTTPNGRDYYPQSPGAITEAIREHNARGASLTAVADDMLTLANYCQEAADEREKRRQRSNALPSTESAQEPPQAPA